MSRLTLAWTRTGLLLFVTLVIGACGDSEPLVPKGEGQLCDDVSDRLRECGFYTDGVIPCNDFDTFGVIRDATRGTSLREPAGNRAFNEYVACAYRCLMDLTCDEWRTLSESANQCPPRPVPYSDGCIFQCQVDTFPCAVPAETPNLLYPAVCDGNPQCSDERDEVGCPRERCGRDGTPARFSCPREPTAQSCLDEAFACRDGTLIDPLYRCDGFVANCCEQEDELGCENNFYCADGQFLPKNLVCNGRDDCTEGEDEQGCAAPIGCEE